MVEEINGLSEALPIYTFYRQTLDHEGVEPHFHCYHQLILIREGTVSVQIDGVDYSATADNLVVICDLEQHRLDVRQFPYCRYVFTIANHLALSAIREPQLLSFLTQRPKNFSHVVPLRRAFADELAKCFEKIIGECNEKRPMWSTVSSIMLTDALIQLFREDPSLFPQNEDVGVVRTVLEIQSYISKNFAQRIVLEELASRHFVSKYYLSRKFKEITGFGFKNYLILYRISEAQKLLRHTNLSVTEICYATGYENVNHFIRVFREVVKTSPLQYRKNMKKLVENQSSFIVL